MTIRAIDNENDWTFGKGAQNYRKDADGLKQRIKSRIQSWVGDCFFAKDDGIDWINYLEKGAKPFLDRDIKRTILQTPEVLQIETFESILDQETRNVTVTAFIQTIYGPLEIEAIGGA